MRKPAAKSIAGRRWTAAAINAIKKPSVDNTTDYTTNDDMKSRNLKEEIEMDRVMQGKPSVPHMSNEHSN